MNKLITYLCLEKSNNARNEWLSKGTIKETNFSKKYFQKKILGPANL